MTIKNRIASIFTVLALTLGTGINSNLHAQKFGHIDFTELIRLMPDFKAAQENLEKFETGLKNEIMEMQQEIQEKTERLQRDQADLTELVRRKKMQEIEEMRYKLQEFAQEAQQNYEAEQQKLMQPIYDKVEKALKEIAKENKFTYIFDASRGAGLLFHENGEDVMPLVKKHFNIN
ncbi:MAG: OmpH family outer membrane protein [Cryomorphaceae bacterium]|nr:OmpH family outer membrane protein [Cryomorphaceae bacterium]